MQTMGVIGAGQMGIGIAQTAAQAGMTVILSDISLEAAQKGKERVAKGLDRLVAKEKMSSQSAAELLARITPVGDYAAMTAAKTSR
jgi:3-hydroxybutyryl-CoA dehydrogenase